MDERGHSGVFWGATRHKLDYYSDDLGRVLQFPSKAVGMECVVVFHKLQSADPQGPRLLFASLFASRLHVSYFPFKRQKSPPLSQVLPAEALRPPGCPWHPHPFSRPFSGRSDLQPSAPFHISPAPRPIPAPRQRPKLSAGFQGLGDLRRLAAGWREAESRGVL